MINLEDGAVKVVVVVVDHEVVQQIAPLAHVWYWILLEEPLRHGVGAAQRDHVVREARVSPTACHKIGIAAAAGGPVTDDELATEPVKDSVICQIKLVVKM